MTRAILPLAAILACALQAQSPAACEQQRRHGHLTPAEQCYRQLAQSGDPYLRAEGFWGLGDYMSSNDQFRLAVAQNPKNAHYRVRWGRMYLDHYQSADAAQLFEEALKIQADDAEALMGLALAASDEYEQKAVELAAKAAETDPKLVEARELLARLALEDSDPKKAAEEADKALAISGEALDAMAVHATIDWLDDKKDTPWIDRILKIDPAYGEAYATAGHFFVLNRRYEEGIQFYRKALDLNPLLWSARSELGVNLMRLGQTDEAQRQLEECFNHGYKSPETVNTLRLMDSYKNYNTYRTPATVLVMSKKEGDLLRPYFQAQLDKALATYEKKYHYHLTKPVQIEVYPNHDDFAVRTLGMPGLGGLLGVTFGYAVAMDSPSARKPGSFHWATTMWHELSHVYVLAATNHRVPRWFTEGMAVYEETAVEPDWGDRLDPEAINAIKNHKLLPVADLDRGFVRPSYPAQVNVSYFQAGKICSFIAEKWGYPKLLGMMHSYAALKTTPEAIEENLGMKPEEFDKQFLEWLEKETKKTVDGFAEWKEAVKQMHKELSNRQYDAVIADGQKIRDIYPDYVEGGNVYEALAEAYLAKGDKVSAIGQLERYSHVGGRSPETLKHLAKLEMEQGRKDDAAATLARINFIYLADPEVHRDLGGLLLEEGKADGAIREYQAVLATKPLDQAGAHFNLAQAFFAAHRPAEAKDEVVSSLEAAPGFKPAQRLLLELDSK